MPVRIRLATHPLARKKQPLYHIVVAKSKSTPPSIPIPQASANIRTGRQRKPLEVIGVYDPIPRHPTTPTGEILTNQDKQKKISMNVDRVKYWLSVGAQPTDHCARLFTKVEPIEGGQS
jgi:small subunit ribosomal protein S16